MQQKKLIALAVAAVLAAGILGFKIGESHVSKIETAEAHDLSLVWSVWGAVNKRFYKESKIDEQEMIYGMARGAVESLDDPYSEFYDPEESEELLGEIEGNFSGIGAELDIVDDLLTVVRPLPDSPAANAGVLVGDVIWKIEDDFATDYSIYEAVDKIRGPIGTTVNLTLLRDGADEPIEVAIVRDTIELDSVWSEVRDDGIAIVAIESFTEDTPLELAATLAELKSQNPRGIILDLRYNTGGVVDAAVFTISEFLEDGTALRIRERGEDEIYYPVFGDAAFPEIPLVVLVNEWSASASEIVAGALQDSGRAEIVGVQTFGKGVAQDVIQNFADGSTLLITSSEWLTPDGRSIHEVGITPDVESEFDIEKWEASETDSQLETAIARLENSIESE